MSTGAVVFMSVSWAVVLGWSGWALWRVATSPRRPEPSSEGEHGLGRDEADAGGSP